MPRTVNLTARLLPAYSAGPLTRCTAGTPPMLAKRTWTRARVAGGDRNSRRSRCPGRSAARRAGRCRGRDPRAPSPVAGEPRPGAGPRGAPPRVEGPTGPGHLAEREADLHPATGE